MHVEVEGENGFFPPIASNSYILHAIVSRRQGREKKSVNLQYDTLVCWDDGPNTVFIIAINRMMKCTKDID
mgnify:CR=1 FL=1